MIQIQLKQATEFNGTRYGLGFHAVPDECADGAYFKALVADGKLIVKEEQKDAFQTEPAKVVPVDSGNQDGKESKEVIKPKKVRKPRKRKPINNGI
jgi:hypothetical protein